MGVFLHASTDALISLTGLLYVGAGRKSGVLDDSFAVVTLAFVSCEDSICLDGCARGSRSIYNYINGLD